MKNILKVTAPILFCFIFLSNANAQNEIKFLSDNINSGATPLDDAQLYLNYDYILTHAGFNYNAVGDTISILINKEDGKFYSSKFLPRNGDFIDVSGTTVPQMSISIYGEKYMDNGLFEVKFASYLAVIGRICTIQISIFSKSKDKTYKSGIYSANSCGININESPTEKHLKLFREDGKSFKVYGMNEQSQLQFYNVLGKIIDYRIISRQEDFYRIQLEEPLSPALIIFDGVREKL